MKRKYIIFILVFIFLLFGSTISYGAYSATNSTVDSGGSVTVKVTSSEALDAYNVDLKSHDGLTFNNCNKSESGAIITINGSSIGYMNVSGKTTDLGTYTFTAPKVTEDKEYTITFSIDKKTTVTSKVTVKAPATNNNSNSSTGNESNNNTQTQQQPSATTTPTPTKSSEARLKNLGIKPNDFSGFKKDKTEYTTEVPNDVAEVEVYATALDSKATVKGTGKISLKEGDNTAKVTVTAEDGKTTKTYTLTIKRNTVAEEEEKAGEATLSQLGIKPEEYDFSGFKSDKTEYSVEVPNEVEEIEIYAKATDSKAQITGTGMIELKEGKNELKVEVIAQNGTKQTYTINVTRETAGKTAVDKFGLSSLSIEGFNLTPSFMTTTYEYTIDVTSVLSSLEIEAKATDPKATVEIVGNENLQEGENTITILVQNKDTEESATYQIIVNKNIKIEQVMETSWLKPSTWGKEEIIKIVIVVVLIILIISAILLKIKMSKENKTESKLDFPGAEELDKAIAEHQELTTEEQHTIITETNQLEEISENQEKTNQLEETSDNQGENNQAEDYSNNYERHNVEEASNNYGEQNYIEDIAKNRFGVQENFEEKPKRKGKHF